MRGFKRLYWARTSDESLFIEKDCDKLRYRGEESNLYQNPYEDEVVPEPCGHLQKINEEDEYEGGRRNHSPQRRNSSP